MQKIKTKYFCSKKNEFSPVCNNSNNSQKLQTLVNKNLVEKILEIFESAIQKMDLTVKNSNQNHQPII